MINKFLPLFLATLFLLLPITGVCATALGESSGTNNPFDDLDPKKWYYESVLDAYARGLVSGTAPNKFEPNAKTSRAMLAVLLWNLDGKPEPAGKSPFTDVKKSSWYGKAVIWAAENKIVAGTGNGKFSPDFPVTREQIAAILAGYVKYLGGSMWYRADLSAFSDANKVSKWAKEALEWAQKQALIVGVAADGETVLDPQGEASRAVVTSILDRFAKLFPDGSSRLDVAALIDEILCPDSNYPDSWRFCAYFKRGEIDRIIDRVNLAGMSYRDVQTVYESNKEGDNFDFWFCYPIDNGGMYYHYSGLVCESLPEHNFSCPFEYINRANEDYVYTVRRIRMPNDEIVRAYAFYSFEVKQTEKDGTDADLVYYAIEDALFLTEEEHPLSITNFSGIEIGCDAMNDAAQISPLIKFCIEDLYQKYNPSPEDCEDLFPDDPEASRKYLEQLKESKYQGKWTINLMLTDGILQIQMGFSQTDDRLYITDLEYSDKYIANESFYKMPWYVPVKSSFSAQILEKDMPTK